MKSIFDTINIINAYNSICEAVTIPPNDDPMELELRRRIPSNYKYGDFIIRWYRNLAQRKETSYGDLQQFVADVPNTMDLLQTYDKYIIDLRKEKRLPQTVDIPLSNGSGFIKVNPVTDFASKIRSVEGAKALVNQLGNILYSNIQIKTDKEKFAFSPAERANIKIIGFTSHVVCWATRTYESTNKFVYQLWQNEETLGRGDVYGDYSEQTPYCTHSQYHWNNYSEGDENYQQYWYLERIDTKAVIKGDPEKRGTVHYAIGDLNNPHVVNIFNLMKGTGPITLIGMNDSGNDFLNRNDSSINDSGTTDYSLLDTPYENDVKQLDDLIFTDGFKPEYSDYGSFIGIVSSRVPRTDQDISNSKAYVVERLAADSKWIMENLFDKNQRKNVKNENGIIKIRMSINDLDGMNVVKQSNDDMELGSVEKIVDGDDYDYFYDDYVDYDLQYDDARHYFNSEMEEYDVDWDDMKNILIGREDEVENIKHPAKIRDIKKLLEENFSDGIGYDSFYCDCSVSGRHHEAVRLIEKTLDENLPLVKGSLYDGGFELAFDSNGIKRIINNWTEDDDNFLSAWCYGEKFSFREPYYGFSDFDNEKFLEGMKGFCEKVKGILSRKEDSEGQMYLPFDKDYLNNPYNSNRER